MADLLQYSDFAGREGQQFVFHSPADEDGNPGPAVEMELIDVIAQNRVLTLDDDDTDQRERKPPFMLIFRGPEDQRLPDVIHNVIHDDFKDLALYVSPTDSARRGVIYEAVFN